MRRKKGNRTFILKSALPEDVLTAGARVTMFGSSSVLVEGQQGVVELSPSCIRLRTAGGILSICGSSLRLRELSADAAMLEGDGIETATYGKVQG